MFQKKKQKKIENGHPTAHVVYAKHSCNIMVLYSSTAVILSQFFFFLVYLKFMLPVHFHIAYYQ